LGAGWNTFPFACVDRPDLATRIDIAPVSLTDLIGRPGWWFILAHASCLLLVLVQVTFTKKAVMLAEIL